MRRSASQKERRVQGRRCETVQNPLAPASELGEKAQVVFVVEADVVDAVFQHGNAQ